MVFLDLHVIDYDGNLMDAAVLGSVAALMNTKIPTTKVENDEIVLDYDNMIPLPVNEKALMCTFAKIGGELLIDPSLEEEEIMGARLSIGMTEDGSICAMQKGGAEPLNRDEILKVVSIAKLKTAELRTHLP
jgi:RNase PH-related exoribonuclease